MPDDAATTEQPAPVRNAGVECWPGLIAVLPAFGYRHLIPDMEARDRLGRERYGTPLTTANGRDHLIDAYQEALDCCVYLYAAKVGQPDDLALALSLESAIALASRLRWHLNEREREQHGKDSHSLPAQ